MVAEPDPSRTGQPARQPAEQPGQDPTTPHQTGEDAGGQVGDEQVGQEQVGGLPVDVEFVIGVDTHLDTHTAVLVRAATGKVVGAPITISTDPDGFTTLLTTVADQAGDPAGRAWAIEGTGSYGHGLTEFLLAAGEWVAEIDRVTRPTRSRDGKSDALDALAAAKEALARPRLAVPKTGPHRAAAQMLLTVRAAAVTAMTDATNQLRALIVTAPAAIRAHLGPRPAQRSLPALQTAITTLPAPPDGVAGIAERAATTTLRALSDRITALRAEARAHEKHLRALILDWRPDLLKQLGVGAVVAATVLTAWSHPGRCRSEAAFAKLAGTAPLPASSGKTVRYRLNRSGNRQLNAALHVIAIVRQRHDPDTRAYTQRCREQGKTDREIRRRLKRYIARQLYRLLENRATTTPAAKPATP